MATEADSLRLVAQVVDGFSQPLRDMARKLREFGDQGKTVNREGRRDTQQHHQAWQDLRKSMVEASAHMRQVLTPTMSELGIGAVTTAGALASVARAVKNFGASAETLKFLSAETGQTTNQLRILGAAAERVGIGAGPLNESLKKFAENMDQARKKHGPFMSAMAGSGAEMEAFNQRLLKMSNPDAVNALIAEMAKVGPVMRRKLAEAYSVPEDFGRITKKLIEETKADLGELTREQLEAGDAMEKSWHRLGDTIKGAADVISADLAPAITVATDKLREFIKETPGLAAIAATVAGMAASWGVIKGIRGVLGVGAGAGAGTAAEGAAAGAAGAAEGAAGAAAAGAGGGILLPGLVAAGAAYGIRSLTKDSDVEGTGYGAHYTGGRSALGVELDNFKKWWAGVMAAHAGADPRSGQGAGHRALMARAGHDGFHPISGAFSDIALGYRGEESIYKGTLKGSREGVIQAFQQIFRDRQAGGQGGGGGIVSAAYHPGEGGGVGGLAGAGGGPGQGTGSGTPADNSLGILGNAHAGQRAILSGHVKEAAQAIRERLGGQPGGSVMDMIKSAAGGDKKIESAMQSIFSGESSHGPHYDIGDKANGPAYGPFQLNAGKQARGYFSEGNRS